MMKVLYPYPVTIPPKESGVYLILNQDDDYEEVIFSLTAGWMTEVRYIKCYYSDQPPPEIENTIEEIKHAIDVRPKDGSEYNHIELTIESAQTLLQTLKAE